MKLERLIYILLALLNKRQITAKEIAERFEISTRTVYRDMDTLSLAGIPIYSERGDKGGFYIPDDYKMDSSFFTEEEKQFIINMSQNVGKIVGHPSFDNIEHKLTSQEATDKVNPFYFDLTSWSLNTNYLLEIEQAIHTGKKISFSYYSKKQERSQRTILPYRLIFKLNAWYVTGYCLEKLELFLNPSKDKVEGSKEEIELIFEESALPKIYDHFTEEEITVEQTRIKVHAFRALTPAFFELILSFAHQVKVISPKELQDKLIITLQKNLQQYDRL